MVTNIVIIRLYKCDLEIREYHNDTIDLLIGFTIPLLGGLFVKHTTKSKILMFILLILQIPAYIPLSTNNTFSLSVTDPSVSQNECVDAWIIILGDRSDHKDWQYLLRNTEFVYDRLLDCGVDETDIYYLVSEIAE